MKNAHQDARNPTREIAGSSAQTVESRATLAADEFYMEGSALVFTAAYHLRRGFCCNSGCRHCPYREPDTAI